MLWSLLVLLVFSVAIEALIVAYTIAVAEKRRVVASILSGIIEPVKLVSLLLVVDSTNKWLSIAVVSVACALGNYWTISAICKMGRKKSKKAKPVEPETYEEAT